MHIYGSFARRGCYGCDKTERIKLQLSCREAYLILRVTPLRKNVKEMKEEEIAAITHHLYCKERRDHGKEKLRSRMPRVHFGAGLNKAKLITGVRTTLSILHRDKNRNGKLHLAMEFSVL